MKRFWLELIISFLSAGIISLFSQIPFISWAALSYSILLLIRLIDSLGHRLPFKELIIAIMGIQMLMSPFLEYYYYQLGIYGGMNVEDLTYYAYVFPCMILLHFGLELYYPRNDFETKLFKILSLKTRENETRGLFLIIIGYAAYGIMNVLPSVGPFGFILELVAFCRFIGFLYIWISGSRYTVLAFLAVIVPFALEAINQTLLIQAIVLFTMLMSIYFMKHKTSRVKIYMVFIMASFLLLVAQSIKYGFRKTVSDKDFKGDPALLFTQSVVQQFVNYRSLDVKDVAAHVNVRINQGWILSDILNNFKGREHRIQPDYFKREVLGILLPRFIYPEKPVVGDHAKFREYTGWSLSKRVSMSVGLMGDGYGNFGKFGGVLYSFAFGLFLGLIFRWWNKVAQLHPTVILWGVMIFFYCMRAGDETYIILNWIVKSSIFVFMYFLIFEKRNSIRSYFPLKPNYAGL